MANPPSQNPGYTPVPDIALPQSRGSPKAGAYWDARCHTRVGPFPWENDSHQEINFNVRIRTLLLFNVHSNKSSLQGFVYSRFLNKKIML